MTIFIKDSKLIKKRKMPTVDNNNNNNNFQKKIMMIKIYRAIEIPRMFIKVWIRTAVLRKTII